jgi:hypothetical protein
MAADSLFDGAAGLLAFALETEAMQTADDTSAGECARTILAARFQQANPLAVTAEEPQPKSVIGLKQ